VPVLVRQVPDEAAAVMALIENIQREDLNPLEEAQGLQRLIDEFKLTHEQAAQAVGRSRSAASNLLRLLNLAAAGAADADGRRPRDGPRPCAAAAAAAQQVMAAQTVGREEAQRARGREARHPAATGGRQAPLLRVKKDKPRDIVRLEEQLSDHLTAQVEIRVQKKGKRGEQGEVAIAFGSLDELNGLLDKLGLPAQTVSAVAAADQATRLWHRLVRRRSRASHSQRQPPPRSTAPASRGSARSSPAW
jgi:ParB family chromosome partitioning protein